MTWSIVRTEHKDCAECIKQAENAAILMKAERATISATGDGKGHRATVARDLN